jgi:phosphatidate cytidylyltransferase
VLKHRLIMGFTLIAALIGALWADEYLASQAAPWWVDRIAPGSAPNWPRGLMMLIIGLCVVPLAAREMGAMFHANGVAASRRWMAFAAIAGLLVCAFIPDPMSPLHAVALVAAVATAVLVGSLAWHIRDKNLHGATAAVGAAMFAFVYLGLMFGFLLALRREHSAWVVAGVLLVTKSCDIGAYFTGRSIGRHKLIPWLSPGKTWEGLFGGVVTAALAAMGGLWLYRHFAGVGGLGAMPWAYAALVGTLFALAGQAGDLLESVLKRDAGVKDSGQTLPGLGGILDVLDSILLTAPLAFWLLTGWRDNSP